MVTGSAGSESGGSQIVSPCNCAMQRPIDSGTVAMAGMARSAVGKAEKRGTVATTCLTWPVRLSAMSMLVAALPSNETVTCATLAKSLRLSGAFSRS